MEWKGHYIQGVFTKGEGPPIISKEPADGKPLWSGHAADEAMVNRAVAAAALAFPAWSARAPEERADLVTRFAGEVENRRDEFARTISRENGKPFWEGLQETATSIAKVRTSITAYNERTGSAVKELDGYRAHTDFRALGAMAVLGPFNFPAHLPGGHIIPALLAGNTIVFKPSEQTPLVGEMLMERWHACGLPPGVINMVQGERRTGEILTTHDDIAGVLFTGSARAGRAIHASLAGKPEKMLALEMGGNNPLVVWKPGDVDAAVYLTLLSAFISSGQRCTCARRLILPEGGEGDAFLDELVAMTKGLVMGAWDSEPAPFLGPVISPGAAELTGSARDELKAGGARELLEAKTNGAFVSPGILDVTGMANVPDEEVFGPLLQVIRVPDFEAAVHEANRTRYGLSAALLSEDESLWRFFASRVRAGIMNWNRQTTGASGALPFGGIGHSGNFRPGGFFAADYCAYPVASLQSASAETPAKRLPGISET